MTRFKDGAAQTLSLPRASQLKNISNCLNCNRPHPGDPLRINFTGHPPGRKYQRAFKNDLTICSSLRLEFDAPILFSNFWK